MRVHVLLLAVSLTLAASPANRDQDRKKTSDKPVITVSGCVDGSWLHVRSVDPGGSYTERYRLRDKPSGDDPTLEVASFVELKESCR